MEQIQEVLHPDSFNIGWDHLPAGGQVVSHQQIHIFPRYPRDGGGSIDSMVKSSVVKNSGNKKVDEVARGFKEKSPNHR